MAKINVFDTWTKEVVLPDHPAMEGTRICHVCGGEMIPYTGAHIYGDVKVSNVHGWYCFNCAEGVLSHSEVGLIESALWEV